MMSEKSENRNFMKDRKIHGESNVCSTAQRLKKIGKSDVHAGFV